MQEQNKRLYWLKLKEDFFDEKYIKIMRNLPEGNSLVVVYLKIQLQCLKTNGYLYFDHLCNTFEEELAVALNENPAIVKLTLTTLEKFNLVEFVDTDTMYLITMSGKIGNDNSVTERVRKYRENKKKLQCNVNVTELKQICNKNETNLKQECNADIDINIDIEKELELDKNEEKDKEKKIEDKFDKFDKADFSENIKKSDSIFTKELIRKGYIEGTDLELAEFDKFFNEELRFHPLMEIFKCINYVLSRLPLNIENKFMYMKTSLLNYLNQDDKYKGTWLDTDD